MGKAYLTVSLFLHPVSEDFALLFIQNMNSLLNLCQGFLFASPYPGQQGEKQSIPHAYFQIINIMENHPEVEFLGATVPISLPFERQAPLHQFHKTQFSVLAILRMHRDPYVLRNSYISYQIFC
jgi:hypothetical protein